MDGPTGFCAGVTSGTARRAGFTLVELLVVIGVIAVLISILIPVISKAWRYSRQVKCASNLRTIGLGIQLYAQDNRGFMPPRIGGENSTVAIGSQNEPNQLGFLVTRGYLGRDPRVAVRQLFCTDCEAAPSVNPFLSPAFESDSKIESYVTDMDWTYTRVTYAYRFHTYQSYAATPANPRSAKLASFPLSLPHRALPLRAWVACLQGDDRIGPTTSAVSHQRRGMNALFCDGSVLWLANTERPDRTTAGILANSYPDLPWWEQVVDMTVQ